MKNKNKFYDVIIVGVGPAGLTAGLYAARRAMKTLIIGQEVGGQMAKTFLIENYPGLKTTNGLTLAFQIKEQAENFGAEFEMNIIKEIKKSVNSDHLSEFEIVTEDGKSWLTKTVILAFGLEKRKLNLKDEAKFAGQGLSYCITCDGPLFKGKKVAVVGGGNAGAEAVEFMAKICPRVYWLEALDHLNADFVFQERIKKLNKVKIKVSTEIVELIGKDKLEGIRVKSSGSKKRGILRSAQDKLKTEGLFVEIGYKPKTNWLKGLVTLDKLGQIKVDELGQTNVPGIFAAGDVTNVKYKQIIVAEGRGAIAALEAYEYINRKVIG